MTENRPVYLNLFKIRLPVPGIVSLAHRVSGVLLFLAIPFAIYLLDLSITTSDGFNQALEILQQPVVMLVQLVLVWSIAHHFFAGIRFLLIDFDIGIGKAPSNISAWLVLVAEVAAVSLYIIGVLL